MIMVRSDAGELGPEAGRQDALHLLHDEVQRSEQRAEELQEDKETDTSTRLTSCIITDAGLYLVSQSLNTGLILLKRQN